VTVGNQDPTARVRAHPTGEPTHEPPAPDIGRPWRIGRYQVLRSIGKGGMGRVFLAYDAELDRNVAVKVVAREPLRLRREAQAMAKLNHPNVAAVHEVGWDEVGAFVVMELVEGVTLRAWLDDRGHSLHERIAVMVAAGRGLAAAHARGLVHRDFKPSNVMVGKDGTVKVLDFGLAIESGPTTDEHAVVAPDAAARSSGGTLTETGLVLGTPAYMAPEQHRGERADAKSDQFSFCVALHEAVFGRRPPAIDSGAVEPRTGSAYARALADRAAPQWLADVVERGLSIDPDRRYPTMDALLAAIAHGTQRGRRRVRLALGAAALAVLGGWLGARAIADARARSRCDDDAGQLAREVWTPDARARLYAAFAATGVDGADATAERTSSIVDAWTTTWIDARRSACIAGEVETRWDAATLSSAHACLDERRWALEGLLGVLADADATMVHLAIPSALALPSALPCADARELAARPAPPAPEARELADAIGRKVEAAKRHGEAGRFADAAAIADDALAQAEALGHPPLVARALVQVASAKADTGDLAGSERAYERAVAEGLRAGADDVVAEAMTELVLVVGDARGRHEDAQRWAELAEAWLVGHGLEAGLQAANLWNNVAVLHRDRGELDEARRIQERALAIREEVLGRDHVVVAVSLTNLGTILGMSGALPEARALFERSLAIQERVLGPDHPDCATTSISLGNVDHLLGDHDAARLRYERALAVHERAYGPRHPAVTDSLSNLAVVHATRNDLARAEAMFERVLEIRREAQGPDHPGIAVALVDLGRLHAMQQRNDAARREYQEAIAMLQRVHGAEHPAVADARAQLAALAE
jgi:tetratricopeptide (TPR) repeat protein